MDFTQFSMHQEIIMFKIVFKIKILQFKIYQLHVKQLFLNMKDSIQQNEVTDKISFQKQNIT